MSRHRDSPDVVRISRPVKPPRNIDACDEEGTCKTNTAPGIAPAPYRPRDCRRSGRQLRDLADFHARDDVGQKDVEIAAGGGMVAHVDDLQRRHELVDALLAILAALGLAAYFEDVAGGDPVLATLV